MPARILSEDEDRRLTRRAEELGLRVTRGGRFRHLLGSNDKGRAARVLMAGYRAGGRSVASLGLGDGPNDLELLAAMDELVVVARPDGTHSPELRAGLPHARFTGGVGPEGFAEAVLAHLASCA